MKNAINSGSSIVFTAGTDVASGAAIVVGTLLAVAVAAVANGKKGVGEIEGAFELPKLSTAVVAQGVRLTWDVSDGKFIVAAAVAGDLENCAVAIDAAGNGVTTVRAKLCPGAGTIKA